MNVWKDSPEMNGTDLLGKRCTELYSISATPTQFRVLNNPNNYSACTMQLPATHYFNYSKGYENTNLVCHYTSALGTTKGSLKSLWKACPLDFKEKRIQIIPNHLSIKVKFYHLVSLFQNCIIFENLIYLSLVNILGQKYPKKSFCNVQKTGKISSPSCTKW